jgi:hypothetical protein
MKNELTDLKLKLKTSFDDLEKDKKKEMKMNKNKFVQKQVFCSYCKSYQDQTHFCKMKAVYINYDRYNKLIIEAATLAGAQRTGDVDGDSEDCDSITAYKNVMEMDLEYHRQCKIWKEEDEKNNIKEEQKEDIQRFNKTMKTFGIDQDEVNRLKTILETSRAVKKGNPPMNQFLTGIEKQLKTYPKQVIGYTDKFLHVLLMFKNKPGSEKWCHTLDQLRKWNTLPEKLVTELSDSVKNDKEWRTYEFYEDKERKKKWLLK